MTTTTTALVPVQPAFTDAERLALAGFLAGYRGLTREAYALDLRQFTACCRNHSLPLFAVRRADIEGFARDLEAKGRARATVTRRLCTIAGSCKYAVEEELLEHSPAAHVRHPRLDYESHATALDRDELGALLVAAGLGPPTEHALISLLALNGLRISEATGADIGQLGLERGHRTLTITRKGGKVVTIPLAPRTARATGLATGERSNGPIFLTADGRRLDRHGAGRIVRRVARRAGITKNVSPARCAMRSSLPRLMPGCRCAMCKKPHPMLTRAPRSGMTVPEAASTGTPRISSPRLSRAPPGNPRRPAVPPGRLAAPPLGGQALAIHNHGRAAVTGRSRKAAREPPFCTGTAPSVRSVRGAQNGIFCPLLIFWRMRGEVQRSEAIAPGRKGYESGLRDRRDPDSSIKTDVVVGEPPGEGTIPRTFPDGATPQASGVPDSWVSAVSARRTRGLAV
jgi:integrase/recombinase XerD